VIGVCRHGIPLLVLVASLLGAPASAPAEKGEKPVPGSGSGEQKVRVGEERAEQDPAPLAPGEVRVRAESYEQTSKGHIVARGLVDLRAADVRIQADKADVFEDKQPDGSTRQRIVAEGNVVFIRGEERLSGDRLEMDDSGKGVLLNAVGYLEPGVFVEARKIERLDADSYRVEGGTFSSCSQSNPRWSFSASRARVDVDDKITGTSTLFRVKGVPAFYTPYVYYPIRKDRRSTGFLLPSVGYSADRGYNLKAGFFWAMGRSVDQTFSLDYYSKAGYGLGHELRWVGRTPSRWTLRSLLFDVRGSGKSDYTLDWSGLQQLPGKLRASANVRLSSSTAFAQQYEGDSVRSTLRSNTWSVSLDRDFGLAVLSAYGQATNRGTDGRVDGRVPGLSLQRFPRQIWGGLVFGLQGSAERILYGTRPRVDAWTRYYFAPTLSRPLQVSFLEIDPSVGYRYTRYGASAVLDGTGSLYDENDDIERSGPPVDRSFFETSIAMRGPTFARVFDTPGFGYSDRFKHTIGPEITWTHRTPVADFAGIPPSGEQDRLVGTSQIDYALVQRFYAKRRGQSGKSMPYDFLSWRLSQTYYVRSTRLFGTDERPERSSPIESRLTLRPTPQYSFDYLLKYDVNSRQVRHTSASASTRRPGLFLEASWQRNLSSADDLTRLRAAEEALRDRSETLKGSAALDLLSSRLTFQGEVDYDVAEHKLWQVRGLVRYSAQCCGFTIEHNWRRNKEGPPDAQWRFSVELANIGSIGGSPPATRDGGVFGLGIF
jgi:LPS-assembly protein